ncbi:MAG: RICIN domain-containing protein, partial [Lachnospiraceae bacterium]|nr:RICIN domain-containing protein [Lachnospiraceae bacterium]
MSMKKILSLIIFLYVIFEMPINENLFDMSSGMVKAQETLLWPVPGHKTLSRGYSSGHTAMDISDSNITGATIVAAMGGTVENVFKCAEQHYGSYGDCYGFGTGLIIRGTDGRYYIYAHMLANSMPSNIYVGATISKGQTLGQVGTTGNSTGAHLHFAIAQNSANKWSGDTNPETEVYDDATTNGTVDVGTGFYAYIINTNQWRHLTNDGNNISLRTETGAPNQIWYFERLSNGDYNIKSVADNTYMEVANNSSAAGANVQTGSYSGKSGQQWCIYGESAIYVFGVRCSNCVLELKNHSTTEGANICVNTPSDTVKQYFQIWKLDNYVQASSVTLNKTSVTLSKKGATVSLAPTILPSTTTTKSVTWSSSNTNVATVNANGVVTAVGNGTAIITVKTASGSKTATCKVIVSIVPTGVSLNKTSATLTSKGATLS